MNTNPIKPTDFEWASDTVIGRMLAEAEAELQQAQGKRDRLKTEINRRNRRERLERI